MAETACLRRSFSNPSEISLDFSQGDPARALGESVSFGRYMSESLAWEKWSAFTNNRYLEEAERYSKPGSVAKMKAYFEAHYGRFGAKKNAARQQANNNVATRIDVEDTDNILSLVALNPEPFDGHSSIPESPTVDNADIDVPSSGIVGSYSSSGQPEDVQNEAEESSVADQVNCHLEFQVHQCQDIEVDAGVIENSVEINVQDSEKTHVITIPECKVTVKNEVEQENPGKKKLDSLSEENPEDYSAKRLEKTNLSKLSSSLSRLATPVRRKKEGNGTPNSKVSNLSTSFARLATPGRPRKEIHATPDSKVAKLSSSLARLATPKHLRKEGHFTPSSKMLVKESIDKKKPISNTLQKSKNISSDINVMKKPSPASRKAGLGKVFTPLGNIIRDSFASSSTPSRASVNSVSRHPSATPQSETRRRSRVALEKSFDRSRRLELKLKSPSTANVKSPKKSSVTFASFSFRTEERAAKRQESIQKRLEKKAENLQPIEKRKAVKPTPDYRKSSQSRNLKANAVAYIRTEVLSDTTKKIPPSGLLPPKCKPKPASDLTQDKTVVPSQRATGSKPSSESKKALSSTLMTKTKRHENASPNIL
ncbi:hypothetical protein vseg_015284 [Gypsophila vaccaria]